ncbi:hypothetical protein LCGC14_0484850 [marine sediment metagenome]|uniref:Uncharacterized protein n=1 Tax=marine sediment metagenome TaxID=412755 RepID=A0A0F9SRH2_9ZZZZ
MMNVRNLKNLMKGRKVLKECQKRGRHFEMINGRKPTEKEAQLIAWTILKEITGLNQEQLEETERK